VDVRDEATMARKLLFLLHGIGQRAPDDATDKPRAAADGWWREMADTIIALAAEHAPGVEIGLNPSANGIKIVPLSYCDLLIRQLQSWDTLGNRKVADAVARQFPGLGAEFVDVLRDISMEDSGFFWSGGVDVLLYRVFHDVEIRTHVRQQVTRALFDNANANVLPSCGFISHSMGTAVLHDVLAELFVNPQEFGGFVNMDVEVYASLANVSKVLSNDLNPHSSPVRPFGASGPGRARVRTFINAHHACDPVPLIGLFKPGWNPLTTPYLDVTIDCIKEPNTHAFHRYVEHPNVWVPIFRTLLEVSITQDRQAQLVTSYEAAPAAPCPQALESVRHTATELARVWREKAGGVGVWQFAVALTKAYRALAEAREACAAESAGAVPVAPS
jgi:hypothetical protein